MNKVYRWIAVTLAAVAMTACDEQKIPDIEELLSQNDSTEVVVDDLSITDVKFSDDHKIMELSAKLLKDIGASDLSDTSAVRVLVQQQVKLPTGTVDDENVPVFSHIEHVGKEEVAKIGLKLLVLVDLSLPQSLVVISSANIFMLPL